MIGIITSQTENYPLIRLCHQQNLAYTIIADTLLQSYQDQDPTFIKEQTHKLITYGQSVGCTHFLVSPSIELLMRDEPELPIIPLFHSYLHYCYSHSLVGKIGYIGGRSDIAIMHNTHKELSKQYRLQAQQLNTRPFHQPLAQWTKDTSLWTYLRPYTGSRTTMINKIIKFDLRYFKDANIDTLIPLRYEYFSYQRTISQFFNPKKQKFHKRSVVATLAQDILPPTTHANKNICTYSTGPTHLLQQKKYEIIASHGGKYTLHYQQIAL